MNFPKFGSQYSRRNILENANKTYLQQCIYDAEKDPFCPIFRLGDIVKSAGENYSEVAVQVRIKIQLSKDKKYWVHVMSRPRSLY